MTRAASSRTADTRRAADSVAAALAGRVTGVFDAIERIAIDLSNLAATARRAGDPLHRSDLAPLRRAIDAALAAEPRLVIGAGVVLAPELLADAGLWLEWWTTASAGPPQPLRPNLDPASAWFYDYTRAPWFAGPRDRDQRAIVGPYVDIGGTDDYTLTLTLPVRLEHDFLGVAGCDIAIDSLERVVREQTRRLGAQVIMVNDEPRVIASSIAQAYPGSLFAAAPGSPFERHTAHPCPGLPWTLIVAG
jgi:Methyl-accepting chemotaxis protein-like, first PDC sensor domain